MSTGAPKRALADLLWRVAQPLTASTSQADAAWLRSFKAGKAGLTLRERIGYAFMAWSLRLYNPAGDIGLDHPGGHINKADCDAAEEQQ